MRNKGKVGFIRVHRADRIIMIIRVGGPHILSQGPWIHHGHGGGFIGEVVENIGGGLGRKMQVEEEKADITMKTKMKNIKSETRIY